MNNQNILEMKWGLGNPIIYNTSAGNLELLFWGNCSYIINDSSIPVNKAEDLIFNNIVSSIVKIVNETSGDDYTQAFNNVYEKLFSTFVSDFPVQGITLNKIESFSKISDASACLIAEYMKKQHEELLNNRTVVVQTDTGAKDGQNKCPSCGSTEITLNINTGKLKCKFCRCEFEPEKVNELDGDISKLRGQVFGSGATDIVADTNDVVTFKCQSCGAEVVVDTATSTQARCHWCRNTLSVNQQIPNGSIPDVVLPFAIKKEDAKVEIEKFVGKRKFFANPKFSKEFTTDNIMGVYFPYMLVDVNSHASFSGHGEKLIRTYTRGSGDNRKTYYDADLYEITREFDLTIDDLTVESSADKLNNKQSDKTNNVINAIMPFDTENCVKWNSNYIKGYTSEKRDTNVDQLRGLVEAQSKDIARFSANKTLEKYDRGVAWSNEQISIKGQQWKAAYLPVWLYSYQQVSGSKKILHYVAVNARTKETMGSVPLHMPKLLFFSFLVEVLGVFLMLFVDWDYSYLFLSLGFIFFAIMFLRYRNSDARHRHETETKSNMSSVTGNDRFVQHRTGLRNSRMEGANNTSVNGANAGNDALGALRGENLSNSLINAVIDNNAVASVIKNNMNNDK